MTNHRELARTLAALGRVISDKAPRQDRSLQQLVAEVLQLAPPVDSIRASRRNDSQMAYVKALRELEESAQRCKSFGGTYSYLENDLYCIETVAAFSTDGLQFDWRLQRALLERLKGSEHNADLNGYDAREITFHKELLLDSGLATGTWTSNGSYTYAVNLEALTPKGWDLINAQEADAKQAKKTILYVSPDPRRAPRLRLQEEEREIRSTLRSSSNREGFSIETCPSARPRDITEAVLRVKPAMIHFSGHGTASGQLCFENDSGELKPVSCKAIASLLNAVEHRVEFVVLNCCYSASEASVLSAARRPASACPTPSATLWRSALQRVSTRRSSPANLLGTPSQLAGHWS